jgi:chemotaxis protein MotB
MRERRWMLEETDDRQRWMVSYADFITLLFAFFVVLYAISSVDARKWEHVSAGMRAAFEVGRFEHETLLPSTRESGAAGGSREQRIGTAPGPGNSAWDLLLLRKHVEAIGEGGAGGNASPTDPVRVALADPGLVISLASEHFFAPGSARLDPGSLDLLGQIAAALATSDAELRIEGHTDDRRPASTRYASNWELSAARAGTVARHLMAEHRIGASRIGIAGFGSERPAAQNDTPEGRALNRRVDIVVFATSAEDRLLAPEESREALRKILDQLEPVPAP